MHELTSVAEMRRLYGPTIDAAITEYEQVLPIRVRVLGNDHWLTRRCSINLAEIKKHDGPPSSGDGPARTAWTPSA